MISSDTWIDLWLVKRTQSGDKNAFGRIYDRNVARVYHTLRRLTGNAETAEDLTQETFIAAYDSLGSWRGESKFATWLCGIALRKFAVRRRFERREPVTEAYEGDESPALSTNQGDPLTHCTRREVADALDAAIARLPISLRDTFILVRLEGLRYQEAADLLDVPLGTVQSRLNRANQVLREQLSFLNTTDDFRGAAIRRENSGNVL